MVSSISVSLTTVGFTTWIGAPPPSGTNVTVSASPGLPNPDPVTTTDVPPAIGPARGPTLVIVGVGIAVLSNKPCSSPELGAEEPTAAQLSAVTHDTEVRPADRLELAFAGRGA